MELICYRDTPLQQEPRQLSAATYNLAHTLLAQSKNGVVFVPIRSMQYLAVLDAEEFIFLDSANKSWIEIAWQNFHPQRRESLEDPVSYDAVFYNASAKETMKRLQHEFILALQQLATKNTPQGTAHIIKFEKRA